MKRTINMEDNRMNVKNGFTAKIIAATAAAVLAVGIPVSFGISKLGRTEQAAPAALTAAENSAVKTENSTPSASANAFASTDEAALKLTQTEQAEETKKAAGKTEKTGKKKAETAVQEAKLPETVIPAVTEARKTEPAPAAPETLAPISETFVDQMCTMDSSQLRELSGNKYDIVDAARTQNTMFGIRCDAFPEYVFVPEQYNEFSDLYSESDDNIVVPTYNSDGECCNIMLGEKIKQLDLYGNAQIGHGAYVGMRYNDLENALGQDFYMFLTGDSLEMAAAAKIEGRSWLLHFSLTEEQKAEVIARIEENLRNGGDNADVDSGCVDISDIDPVCDIAVLDIYR